jgi:hypothetical protein
VGGLIRAFDVFVVAWVVAWAFAGIAIGRQIQGLAEVTDSARDAGLATQRAGDAIDRLRGLPLVGGAVGDSAATIREAGQTAIDGAARGRTRVRRLGAIVGALIAIVPSLPLLWLYLPGRISEAGDRRRILGRLREGDPAIDELLATRAVAHLPYRTLLAITPDPAEDLRAGRHERLADAELSRLRLPRSARAR